MTYRSKPSQDYSTCDDRALVEFARVDGDRGAVVELLGRHFLWMKERAAGFARRCGLRGQDVDDFGQEVVAALLVAIARHDPQRGSPGRPGFRAYLRGVLFHHLRNSVRFLHRRQREVAASAETIADLATSVQLRFPEPDDESDPAELAVRHEEESLLQRAVEHLEPLARRLWDGRLAGASFHELGHALGLSDDQARRLFHAVFESLANEVRGRSD